MKWTPQSSATISPTLSDGTVRTRRASTESCYPTAESRWCPIQSTVTPATWRRSPISDVFKFVNVIHTVGWRLVLFENVYTHTMWKKSQSKRLHQYLTHYPSKIHLLYQLSIYQSATVKTYNPVVCVLAHCRRLSFTCLRVADCPDSRVGQYGRRQRCLHLLHDLSRIFILLSSVLISIYATELNSLPSLKLIDYLNEDTLSMT